MIKGEHSEIELEYLRELFFEKTGDNDKHKPWSEIEP